MDIQAIAMSPYARTHASGGTNGLAFSVNGRTHGIQSRSATR
jgi:hypothetical protein